jgi:hypothetical protein
MSRTSTDAILGTGSDYLRWRAYRVDTRWPLNLHLQSLCFDKISHVLSLDVNIEVKIMGESQY